MSRPTPTQVFHFTHLEHVATVVQHGLLSDTAARERGVLRAEVGNHEIKSRRRERVVRLGAGGVVADYVPFYYAPRSPMMYVIDRGGVPTYDGGCDDLVYLVSTVERLIDLDLRPLFTDRNAVLALAAFTDDVAKLDRLIDWSLMRATMWANTSAEPDRKERRMAECLVHACVPWEAFSEVVTKTRACAALVTQALSTVGSSTPVHVRPDWYF